MMPPRLHHVTVATDPHKKELAWLRESARAGDVESHVLGLGERWPGFGLKMAKLRHFCEDQAAANDDDVVLFTDAYDVLVLGSGDEILRRFLTYPGQPDVLFSAELYAWPDTHRAEEYPQHDQRALPDRYLNSGTFLGRVGALRHCLRKYPFAPDEDDQRWWTTAYLAAVSKGGWPRMALDHGHTLFLCMTNRRVADMVDFDEPRRQWRVRATGGQPLVVHYNGDKSAMAKDRVRWMRVCHGQRVAPASRMPMVIVALILLAVTIVFFSVLWPPKRTAVLPI